MRIYIEDLKFQAILGILDFERLREQDIIITLEIEYKYKDSFINYADVANHIKESMKKEQFLLIEDALESLCLSLKKEFSQIEKLFLKITKPSILPDCKVSVSETYKFDS